jgi:hypothetical protein
MFYVQFIRSIDERIYPCPATIRSSLQEIFGIEHLFQYPVGHFESIFIYADYSYFEYFVQYLR